MEKLSHRYALYNFNWLIIFLAAFGITAGGLIYILIRPSEPAFFHWFDKIGFGSWIDLLRQKYLWSNQFLPDWIIFSLPSGLWAFAYSIIITGIWWHSKSLLKYLWLVSIILLVVGWEILQLTELVRGTYSFGDIISGLMGASIGILIGIKLTKPYNYEKNN